MMRHVFSLVLIAGLALAGPGLAQSVRLQGADGQSAVIDAEALARLPRVSVSFNVHGEVHRFDGPLLIDVLKAVGVEQGAALRGPALAQAVRVSAADGYVVVYGLGELDPRTRGNRIILADQVDGRPLPETDGPYRVVAEGDLRPARAVRQVEAIDVVRLAEPGGTLH